MEEQADTPFGWTKILRRVEDFVLELLEDRAHRILLRIHEEKIKIGQLLVTVGLAIFAGAMATIFASLTVLCFFWESARLAALCGLTLAYTIVLLCLVYGIWKQLRKQFRIISAGPEERPKGKQQSRQRRE